MTSHDVSGLTVVIMGASSGLGRGTAIALAERGANVVVAARRADVLDRLVADIESAGGRAIAVTADVASLADVQAVAARAVEVFGHIDVWINGVGIGAIGRFWDVPPEDHARVVAVNLTGLMHGSHVALRHFLDRRAGVLLNIGSVESKVPLAYQSSYAATKAGVLSLSRSLNEELRLAGASRTVRVGTVLPWAVDTTWWMHAANYTGRKARMLAMDDPAPVVEAIVAACTRPGEAQSAGWKARAASVSHRIMPRITDRVSAEIFHHELITAGSTAKTAGAIHRPVPEGTTVAGGVRRRTRKTRRGRDRDEVR